MGIIYKALNKINNKVYIGQTICSLSKRRSEHISAAKTKQDLMFFHKALNKYLPENFEWSIVVECPNDLLNEEEIYWISYYRSTESKLGYNTSLGGSTVSVETRNKIRNTLTGKHKGLNSLVKDNTIYKFYHKDYGTIECTRVELIINYNVHKTTIGHLFGKHKRQSSKGWKLI